jgi:hypothetical protein
MEFYCLKLFNNNLLKFQTIPMDFYVNSLQLSVDKLIKLGLKLCNFVQLICSSFLHLAIFGLFTAKIINKSELIY